MPRPFDSWKALPGGGVAPNCSLTPQCALIGCIRDIAPAEPIAPSIGYRPGLDGVRALAVAAVILYHGDVSWAKGGFLGVDVFFVLSGFLITSLLLTEHEASGRIDLVRFWTRRARRLLPALFAVLLGVALYAAVWALPTELGRIRGDGLASLLYVSNWRFVLDGSSYFQLFRAPSPLAHTWSLAIEEQWYLLWPLLLLVLLRLLGVRLRLVGLACGVLAAGSAALMAALYHPGADPSRVYYGTDTRAQALLIGAALGALTAGARPMLRMGRSRGARVGQLAGVVGVAVLACMCVRVDAHGSFLYRGGFTLAALAAAALVAAAAVDGPLARVLSVRPLVAVGTISYGLYLWHWPVDVALNASRTGLSGVTLFGVRVAVTLVLATLSYRLLEMPIRRHGLSALTTRVRAGVRRALVPALALSVAAVLAVSTVGSASEPSAAQLAGAQAASHAPPDPARTRILMLGDSQMLTLWYYGSAAFKNSGPQYESAAIVGCGLFDPGMQSGALCTTRARTWRTAIRTFDPDLSVLLVGAFEALDFAVDGHTYRHGTSEHTRELARVVERVIRQLAVRGGRVALLEVPPFGNPLDDAEGRERSDPASIASANEALRTVARRHPGDVTFVPWVDAIAPGHRFAATIDGVAIRPDGVHFASEPGTSFATARLVPILRRLAVNAHEHRDRGTAR